MNPLFNAMTSSMPQNNMLANLANIKNMLQGRNPGEMMQMMLRQNPKFAQFVNENKGKTPDQIAQNYGIDLNQIKNFMK